MFSATDMRGSSSRLSGVTGPMVRVGPTGRWYANRLLLDSFGIPREVFALQARGDA